jgi:phage-related protein
LAALKPVEWTGSSRDELREMPEEVQRSFGYALYQAQRGLFHTSAQRLKGEFGGLIELIDDFDGDTYRAVYTVKLAGVVYVLHVFQKKSKRGIATPRHDISVIRRRWKEAKRHHAMCYSQDYEQRED